MKFKKEEHIFINKELIQYFQTYWQKIFVLLKDESPSIPHPFDSVDKQVINKMKNLFIELTDKITPLNKNIGKKEIKEKIDFFFQDTSYLCHIDVLKFFLNIFTLSCIPSNEQSNDKNNLLCLRLNKKNYVFILKNISARQGLNNGKNFDLFITTARPDSAYKIIEKVDLNNWLNDEFFINLMKYFYNKM